MQFPEHDKLGKVRDRSQATGAFLEWMREEKGWVIAKLFDDEYLPIHLTTERILGEYFGIDPVRLEAEKRAMLALIRDPSMKSVDTVE